jgi:hypothetical protein
VRIEPAKRILIVAVLLLLFAAAAANSLVRESATFDETAHLAAGYTYLDRADFRLNPEHPPLFKGWAALPLWLGSLAEPDYASAGWEGGNQWLFGYELLNGPLHDPQRRSPSRLLTPARMAMLVPALLLGLIVYLWSREIWGDGGALVSLFLYCLSPTMLAHGRLVTTDLPSALGFTAVLWSMWRFCRSPSAARAALCGVSLAAALLMKFSALLLLPIMALLALMWALWPGVPGDRRRRRWLWILVLALIAGVLAYGGLWAGYGFRYAACEPGHSLDWEVITPTGGAAGAAVRMALDGKMLPESYLYGLAYFLGGAQRRVAFLNGEQSIIGWWHYFPQAFLMKSPPSLILILLLLAVAALRRGLWRSFNGWYVALPIALYVGVSILGNLNIGHRHLAPLYPLLFLLCGGLSLVWKGSRAARVAAVAVLAGYAISFAAATPGYLSYFNFTAGGSKGGWRYLLDSNIDWGQDLPRLKAWMDESGIPKIHLAYFGTADPSAYGIRYEKIHMAHDYYPQRPPRMPRSGDHVAVSVNLLQGLYIDRDEAFARELHRRGLIRNAQVREWLDLRDRLSNENRRHPELAEWAVERGLIDEATRRDVGSGLLYARFARLRDEEEPVARAGDSILIYRWP